MENNNLNLDKNIENEENEEETIKRLIEEKIKQIEDSKKLMTQKNEELKLEKEKKIQQEEIIKEKVNQIKKIEHSIKLINERMGECYSDKKLNDVLKNKKNDIYNESTYDVLQYIKEVEASEQAQNWIKDWSNSVGLRVLKSEKLRLMRNLGYLFEYVDKLLEIDNLSFNNMQHNIDKLFTKKLTNEDDPDIKITSTIHIKVYLKDEITSEELSNKKIELDNLLNYNISIIEYDFLYHITNKFKILTIQNMACKYFSLEDNNHILTNENFEIWPFDIYIYDEIFNLNIAKAYVKPHCKFFQLNSAVTENLKFVIIKKEYLIQLCVDTFDNFRFIANTVISKESKMIEYMVGMKTCLEEEIKRDKELQLNKKIEKKKFTRDVIKEQLLRVMEQMHGSDDSNSRGKVSNSLENNNKGAHVFQINTINSNDCDPYKRKKKPKDFRAIATRKDTLKSENSRADLSVKSKKSNLSFGETQRITDSIKEKIRREYPEILEEFNMDIDNFIQYCDKVIQNKKRILDLIIDEENQLNEEMAANPNQRLFNACAEMILNNKDSSLIPKQLLIRGNFEHPQEYYAGRLIDLYIRKREEEKIELKELRAALRKEEMDLMEVDTITEIIDKNKHVVPENEGKNTDYDKRIPNWLRVTEFLTIFLYITLIHFSISYSNLTEASFFNKKIIEMFDDKSKCNAQLIQVQSPSLMTDWIIDCYIPTISKIFKDLDKNMIDKQPVMVPYIEIHLEGYKMSDCENIKSFNLTFTMGIPQCFVEKENLKDRMSRIFSTFNLTYTDTPDYYKLGMLDYLFYGPVQLDNPSVITIKTRNDFDNFQKYMLWTKDFKNERLIPGSVKKVINTMQIVYNLTRDLSVNSTNLYDVTPNGNNVELVTSRTKNLNIYTYYVDKNTTIIGVIIFQYKVLDASVYTGYIKNSFYSLDLVLNGNSKKTDLASMFQYLGKALVPLILLISFIKNNNLGNFFETLNRSFFLILYLGMVGFEIFYKVYHLFNGTNDFREIKELLEGVNTNLILLYSSNDRMIQSLESLLLCYHLMYVVFSVKDLIVFTIFLKPVFQRFFMVVILFNLAYALIQFLLIGSYYAEFYTLTTSFISTLSYTLGMKNNSLKNDGTFTFNIKMMWIYLKVINYFFSLFIMNFSLIVMFYFYRKTYHEDAEKDEKKKI